MFPKYSAVVFVHGCFWHIHDCARSTIPETRGEWWRKKLQDKQEERDAKVLAELQSTGWRVLVMWECFVRRPGINREWIAELKTEHAQRAAEEFGRNLSRVGLTESEWLRLKAR